MAGCREKKQGVLLHGSLSLWLAPGQNAPAHPQSPYTQRQQEACVTGSAGSSGGGQWVPWPGDPQVQPAHTHNSGWGLSPRTNDSVCGKDHDTGAHAGCVQGPLLSTVSTTFATSFLCVCISRPRKIHFNIKSGTWHLLLGCLKRSG